MALTVSMIGLLSLISQTILLRRLFTISSGTELHIGMGLGIWLLSSSLGVLMGKRLKKEILGILFIIAGIVLPLSLIFTDLIRPFSGGITGEDIPFFKMLFFTFITIFPVSAIFGLLFSASLNKWQKGPLIFSLEAIGAFLGGLIFVFILSGRLNSYIIIQISGLLSFIIGICLSKRRWFLIVLIVYPLLYLLSQWSQEFRWSPFKYIKGIESRYQEITLLFDKGNYIVYAGGRILYSYPDPLREELDVHIPMSLHSSPERILLIGGNLSGVKEFLKYPVQGIHIVEIDPAIIKLSYECLNQEDRFVLDRNYERWKVFTIDPRLFVKKEKGKYDLIIFNTSEPSTALGARLYTLEFFRDLKKILAKNGLIIIRLPHAYGFMSRPLRMLNGSVYNTLKEVFPYVDLSSEEYGIVLASDIKIETDPLVLMKRFNSRDISTSYFEPALFNDIFLNFKKEVVRKWLSGPEKINADNKPIAYLYGILFWAYSEGGILPGIISPGVLLIIMILSLVLLSAIFILKTPLNLTIFTTGYSTMAFSITVLLSYQVIYGYIYETIGLIASLFMLGLSMGSWFFSKEKPVVRGIMVSELSFVVIFFLSIYILKFEVLFYIMSFVTGFLGGAQFSLANNISKMRGGDAFHTGNLYAIDLIGSFTGAIFTTLYIIPHLGIDNSFLLIGFIKIGSLIFLKGYERL